MTRQGTSLVFEVVGTFHRFSGFVAAILVTCAIGCGETRLPVEGHVRFTNGDPLPTGDITLYPDTDGAIPSDRILFGKVGPDGRYLIELDGVTGAPPDKYRVVIAAASDERPPSERPNPMNYYPIIDRKYFDHETTPLRIEVVSRPEPGAYDLEVDPF